MLARRFLVAVMAGVLLVGALTFLLLRDGTDDSAPVARTAPADATQPTEAPPPEPVAEDGVECPAPRRISRYRDLAEETPLPEGAVALRLCAFGSGGARGTPPPDVLVGPAVTSFVDLLERQEVPRRSDDGTVACTSDGGTVQAFVLGYPDGTRRVVTAANYGCEPVIGAGPARTGGREVTETFFSALTEARGVSPTPDRTPPPPACLGDPGFAPSSYSGPAVRLEDAVSAVVCWDPREIGDEVVYREAALGPGDLATVLADYRQPGRSPGGCRVGNFALVFGTHWGDVGTAVTRCGRWSLDGVREQLMGAAAVDVFRPIVGGHRRPGR